ncbi:MAG: CRISPR-associated endonuclease Cas1 [Deltaproteobacteria bacterium]|nr:CRISPR-associated endonuclease Cas1 [Deltaproteobacteria bacterium]MBW2018009.1 CRISPR-associated endonuclease Cas1 [Deltaproteobacteria bacterium]MBW2130178.1 CRISPR-associated endonuclease Cas1 [Deltaproteobacteria bacterium]MBW2304735.1 CRISPR-associated endonuclease Cas1 [Deltaproteobacteria bacterium]
MESIYVLEPGAYLRREGRSLKVVKGGKVIQEIPAEGLKKLMLVGYVSLSGGVLDFLIQNRVETVFITPSGRFRARLALDEHRHVALRKAQYVRLSEPGFALNTARIIVQGKIGNMARFLLLRARQYNNEALRIGAVKLKSLAGAVRGIQNLDMLRGLEGNATRIYFELFHYLIRNSLFEFHGRNRRPPLDPVNAMLSFVYTLLTNEVLSAIKTCGLDPYLGCLHEVSYGRPSLACDLVEEYRCFLGDRIVLGLINRKAVTPDDFVFRKNSPDNYVTEEEMKAKRPVEMKPSMNRVFVKSYERVMNKRIRYGNPPIKTNYRMLILHQSRAFARYLEDPETPYVPFEWEA